MRATFVVLLLAVAVVAREVKVPCISTDAPCKFAPLREALESAEDGDVITLSSSTYMIPCAKSFAAPIVISAKTITIDIGGTSLYPEAHFEQGRFTPDVPYDEVTDCAPMHFQGDVVWKAPYFGLPYVNISAAGSISFVESTTRDPRFPTHTFFSNSMGIYGVEAHPRVTLEAGDAITIDNPRAHAGYILTVRTPNLIISNIAHDTFASMQLCGCGTTCLNITGDITTSCHGMIDDTAKTPATTPELATASLPTVECLYTANWALPIGIGFVLGTIVTAIGNRLCARRVTVTCDTRDANDSSPPGYETVSREEVHEEKAAESDKNKKHETDEGKPTAS